MHLDIQLVTAHAAVVAAGVFALHVFYRSVQTAWPQSYMSASDYTGQLVSGSIVRYSAYRALPVFAVAFFVAGSLRNAEQPAALTSLAVGFVHIGVTNAVAVANTVQKGRAQFGFISNILFHLTASATALLATGLGILAAQSDRTLLLLPTPRELSTALWTAIAAALLGVYVIRISSAPHRDPTQMSRSSIPARLWETARSHSLANGTDPALVTAIMVVENMQRPRWLRRLEGIKARLGLPGTYGIMQVTSDTLLDDESSIRLSCEGHLKGVRPQRTAGGQVDWESVQASAALHNPDPVFVQLVASIFWEEDARAASFRAHPAIARDAENNMAVTNTGGIARDLVVYRVRFEGDEVLADRTAPLSIEPGGETRVEIQGEVPLPELPTTRQGEWPAVEPGGWLVRMTWVNEDYTPGDTGWTIV